MNYEDELIRARLKLQKKYPFYYFVLSKLKQVFDEDIKTAGVNPRLILKISPSYIERLNQEELLGLLAHEVLHVALLHITVDMRQYNVMLMNIAMDIVINYMLRLDMMTLPRDGLIPDINSNSATVVLGPFVVEIKDISKKNFYQIYDELYEFFKNKAKSTRIIIKDKNSGMSIELGDDKSGGSKGDKGKEIIEIEVSLDDHDFGGKISPAEEQKVRRKVMEAVANGMVFAKSRGIVPGGANMIYEMVYKRVVPWEQQLQMYFNNSIPTDFSWSNPNKTMLNYGQYYPGLLKEGIKAVILLDVSGSISDDNLKNFLGQAAFITNVTEGEFIVIQHDVDVQKVDTYQRGDMLRHVKFEVKGRGGTSHIPVNDYIAENHRDADVIIAFTDAYTEFPDNPVNPNNWIWCVINNSDPKIPYGKVIPVHL